MDSPRAFDPHAARQVSRRNLPHWRQEGVVYFVTFRLADALPAEKLAAWRDERARWLGRNPAPHTPEQARQLDALWDGRLNGWLDAGHGSCCLRSPGAQEIVEGAMRFFDGRRYRLGDFVVMPNHVHVLVMPLGAHGLSAVLHSWKSFTSNQLNRALGRSGQLWQDESFDHIVRDDGALARFARYVRENWERAPTGDARLGTGTLGECAGGLQGG